MAVSPHLMGLFTGLAGLFGVGLALQQAAACVLVILACIKYLKK